VVRGKYTPHSVVVLVCLKSEILWLVAASVKHISQFILPMVHSWEAIPYLKTVFSSTLEEIISHNVTMKRLNSRLFSFWCNCRQLMSATSVCRLN